MKNSIKTNNSHSNILYVNKIFSIKLTLYFLIFSIIEAKLNKDHDENFILNNLKSTATEHNINETILNIIMSMKETENGIDKVKQKLRNKMAHIKNGNKKEQRNKNKKAKYFKISQLNKGNSYITKHLEMLKLTIQKENPGILVLPESQISVNELNLNTNFQGYSIENKFLPGQNRARVSV